MMLKDASYPDVSFMPCSGGICAAAGIKAAGVHAGFRKDPTRLDLALVVADEPAVVAATFTQNQFSAAPVQVSKQRAEKGMARAVMLNSGNANAATGARGLAVATKSAALLAHELGCPEEEVLVASTGVIGVQLPLEPFDAGIGKALWALGSDAEAAEAAARAVMTTDTHPKQAALVGQAGGRTVHVGGFVKGSGMIQPNMATMLCVLACDAPLTHEAASAALKAAVDMSFNKVTVDSDMSTNDSCFLFATGAAGGAEIGLDSVDYPHIAAAIQEVCESLAQEIAKDGEGSTKLITVCVNHAPTDAAAELIARSIANSPLVKTAVFGHDANWGRVCAAAGKAGVAFDQTRVDVDFLGVRVCEAGMSVEMDEQDMLKRFESDEIPIVVDLHAGTGTCRIWTCDLTHDYVTINGEYRT